MTMEPSEWQEVIDTNLTGYFNMAKACIVTMLKQKSGNIINISSVAGVVGIQQAIGVTGFFYEVEGPFTHRFHCGMN